MFARDRCAVSSVEVAFQPYVLGFSSCEVGLGFDVRKIRESVAMRDDIEATYYVSSQGLLMMTTVMCRHVIRG
jgi:hypothetical protein